MKNLLERRNRFLKEDAKMRVGHLASDLARIASLIKRRARAELIQNVIQEAKFFSEWAVGEVETEIQMLLADIQSFLALKELQFAQHFEDSQWRTEVETRLRSWANELLHKAGLL